jgi:hypothetical protein
VVVAGAGFDFGLEFEEELVELQVNFYGVAFVD